MKKCFFIHPPKCAGTSFWAYCGQHIYGFDKCFPIRAFAAFFDDTWIETHSIGHDEIAKSDWIGGHYSYPCLSAMLGPRASEFEACILLREPIDRVLSSYNYRLDIEKIKNRNVRDDILYEDMKKAGFLKFENLVKASSLDREGFLEILREAKVGRSPESMRIKSRLPEFISRPPGQILGDYVRGSVDKETFLRYKNSEISYPNTLTWGLMDTKKVGMTHTDWVEKAKSDVGSCWIGLTDRTPQSYRLFHNAYGWGEFDENNILQKNISENPLIKREELSDDTIEDLKRLLSYDYEIYEHTKALHYKQCEEMGIE